MSYFDPEKPRFDSSNIIGPNDAFRNIAKDWVRYEEEANLAPTIELPPEPPNLSFDNPDAAALTKYIARQHYNEMFRNGRQIKDAYDQVTGMFRYRKPKMFGVQAYRKYRLGGYETRVWDANQSGGWMFTLPGKAHSLFSDEVYFVPQGPFDVTIGAQMLEFPEHPENPYTGDEFRLYSAGTRFIVDDPEQLMQYSGTSNPKKWNALHAVGRDALTNFLQFVPRATSDLLRKLPAKERADMADRGQFPLKRIQYIRPLSSFTDKQIAERMEMLRIIQSPGFSADPPSFDLPGSVEGYRTQFYQSLGEDIGEAGTLTIEQNLIASASLEAEQQRRIVNEGLNLETYMLQFMQNTGVQAASAIEIDVDRISLGLQRTQLDIRERMLHAQADAAQQAASVSANLETANKAMELYRDILDKNPEAAAQFAQLMNLVVADAINSPRDGSQIVQVLGNTGSVIPFDFNQRQPKSSENK